MNPQPQRRVGLFQFGWPVQSQTVNAAIMLADAGYAVDLFLSRAPLYVDPSSVDAREAIHLHVLDGSGRRAVHAPRAISGSLKRRTADRLLAPALAARRAYWLWPGSRARLVPRSVMSKTMAAVGSKRYSCLIGVEKEGLAWAGRVAERIGAPLVYYSLELYLRDDPVFDRRQEGTIYRQRVKEAEAHYHRRAAATIVQTAERARLLYEDTGAQRSRAKTFYVPVSMLRAARSAPSMLLHDVLGLGREQKIVLYFGMISAERYALELARAAQRFRDDWTLVMHGFGEPRVLRQIKHLDKKSKVALSLEMLSSTEIGDVVGSAAVGVALYQPTQPNDRLTAFASEKMALYLQHGVPFISFDYTEYRQLVRRYRCGEVVSDVADLPKAVATILRSHDAYRANTAVAFAEHYDFARNFRPVIEGIGRLH
jgi:glycosyltransferase involved in cell wall biosynthesis